MRRLGLCFAMILTGAFTAVIWADAPKTADTKPAATKPVETKSEEPKKDAKPESKPGAGDKLSVTEHEATVGGKLIKYKATAGTYQMKDEAGKHKAEFFFVAYEKTPVATSAQEMAKRPVTFVFNGGPGAASVWLHMGTAGPRRVKLTDLGEATAPPYQTVENEFSWLDASDLVFIDPVGTGYSRAAQGEDPRQFYGVQEDLDSVAEFIRLYTTRNQRWPSPKFLAGESYGTTRAAALSAHLLRQQGIALNGIVLISTVLNFQTISFGAGNDQPYVLFLPTYTAAAHYHKKLLPELQADLSKALKESEKFAIGEYAAALAKGASLTDDEKADIARKLSRLTGLTPELARKANLRIDSSLFRKSLLVDQDKVIGRFDARLAGFDPDPLGREPDHDPSFNQFFALYASGFNDYVRRSLKYESDLPYEVLSGRVRPWNFGQGGNGFLNVADDLEQAMRLSPHMKVLVCSGVCDLATPYFGAHWTVNHIRLSPELRKNISEAYYPGGHMVYHEIGSLKKLKEDVAGFMEAATK